MSDGGDGIHVSLKEILEQVNTRFKDIQAELKGIREEQGLFRKDWSGLEYRIKEHFASPGHPQALERITAIEHDLDALQEIAKVQQAVKSSLEAAAERDEAARAAAEGGRRWIIGLGFTILLSLLGIALKLFAGAS